MTTHQQNNRKTVCLFQLSTFLRLWSELKSKPWKTAANIAAWFNNIWGENQPMTSVKLRDTHRRNLSCLRARSKKCRATEPTRSTERNASARARFVVGRLLQGAHLKASCVSASASETLCWLSLFFGSSACNASPTTSNKKKRSQAKLQMSTARSTFSETFPWSLDGLIPNLSLILSQTVSSPSLFDWKMLSSHFLIEWAHSVKEEDKAAPSLSGFSDRTVTFI